MASTGAANAGEPVQLVNREVYEIVRARLHMYEEIATQCGVTTLRDLNHARWICEVVQNNLGEEDQYSFEVLQGFIQEARKRFDLANMTKSEWLQLVNLRPTNLGAFDAIVSEAGKRFPDIYNADGENLLLELIRESFHGTAYDDDEPMQAASA